MTNLVDLLDANPEKEVKLLSLIGKRASDHVTLAESKTIPYLDATINESLRLGPSVANDLRIAPENFVLPSGMQVRKFDKLMFAAYCIGRNPLLWSNPDSFSPERWIKLDPEGKELPVKRPDEYLMPVFFGLICSFLSKLISL